jgi:DNA-binding NarL/FixJ family response regulator
VLATGASTDEVASRLRMSTDEVRRHIRNCLWTLQARSKLEAVLLALAAGVIGESLK